MSKRKGTADAMADVEESKKAKSDPPTGESSKGKSHKPKVEKPKPDALEYMQIIITGSRGCGKSCLVLSYLDRSFPPRNSEFLSKQYLHVLKENDQSVMIWDLDAREDFSEYRHQSYQEADLALLCFDVQVPNESGSESSLERVIRQWISELNVHCSDIPIILVGLKKDLKFDRNSNFFSDDDVNRVMRNYPRIVLYREVSAHMDKDGVKELFTSAIARISTPKRKIMFTNRGFEILSHRWLV